MGGLGFGYMAKGAMRGMDDVRRNRLTEEQNSRAQSQEERRSEQYEYEKGLRGLRKRSLEAQVSGQESGAAMRGKELGRFDTEAGQRDEIHGLNVTGKGLSNRQSEHTLSSQLPAGEIQQERRDRQEFDSRVRNYKLDTYEREAEITEILQGPKTVEANSRMMEAVKGQYKGIYQLYKLGAGQEAAEMINRIKSNGIESAADVVEIGGFVHVVDGDGSPVIDARSGKPYSFSSEQAELMFGESVDPVKVGDEETLVNPKTGAEVFRRQGVNGSSINTDKKYNQQSAYGKISGGLKSRMGGTLDAGGNWTLPEGNTGLFSRLEGIAHSIERRSPNRYSPGEIADLVYRRKHLLKTLEEATAEASAEAKTIGGVEGFSDEEDFPDDGSREAFINRRAREIMDQGADDFNREIQRSVGGVQKGKDQEQSEGPPTHLLSEGKKTRFENGQVWTLSGGRAVRVK